MGVAESGRRVACITGGGSGIGLATARLCAAKGMRLVLADADPAALASAVAELRGVAEGGSEAVVGVECDVASGESMEGLREEVWARFGGCSLLALNVRGTPCPQSPAPCARPDGPSQAPRALVPLLLAR